MKTSTVILILFAVALAIGIAVMLLVFRDYEHEKNKCGNCVNRDECLHYCWARDWEVGTETKACSLFQNKHKL